MFWAPEILRLRSEWLTKSSKRIYVSVDKKRKIRYNYSLFLMTAISAIVIVVNSAE